MHEWKHRTFEAGELASNFSKYTGIAIGPNSGVAQRHDLSPTWFGHWWNVRKTSLPKGCSKIIGTNTIRVVCGRPKRYREVTERDIEHGLIQVGGLAKTEKDLKSKHLDM